MLLGEIRLIILRVLSVYIKCVTADGTRKTQLVDMTKGLDVELNCYKHKLTFTYEGKTLKEIKNIGGKELHAVILFNGQGLFPIEIDYFEGPQGMKL